MEKKMEAKNRVTTIRLNDTQYEFLKSIVKYLQDQRPPGAIDVTQTEAILILLTLGMNEFSSRYDLKKKQPKK